MKNEVLRTLRYFTRFGYAPTLEELHTFYPRKVTQERLLSLLKSLLKLKKVKIITIHYIDSSSRYTLPGYSISEQSMRAKIQHSKHKIRKIQSYVQFLARTPYIDFVGLSGTVSMMNAEKDDDIDLFIITKKNRLWTGRFVSLLSASVMGLRRRRVAKNAKDKVCLNLFFDGGDLAVPPEKHSEYMAHEVLQVKPLVNKQYIFERFLVANKWVKRYFPNTKRLRQPKSVRNLVKIPEGVNNAVESLLGRLQLLFINFHRTTEYITPTQLWFHPKKLK